MLSCTYLNVIRPTVDTVYSFVGETPAQNDVRVNTLLFHSELCEISELWKEKSGSRTNHY